MSLPPGGTSTWMRSNRGLAYLVGIVMVVWLVGSTSEYGSYRDPCKRGWGSHDPLVMGAILRSTLVAGFCRVGLSFRFIGRLRARSGYFDMNYQKYRRQNKIIKA
ncbi:hypothetical protein AVEN_186091-1 [Araneus ventricosus]|uniref:Uncharacterized protein n=1 Tax=Araneus ventricosus TaxID=182803 RepID=A0A4Y2WK68_ARAVE|nr:hypothetical protein AVEN_186091-1 [Araneus ventricosus]